jgi:transposase-like protein
MLNSFRRYFKRKASLAAWNRIPEKERLEAIGEHIRNGKTIDGVAEIYGVTGWAVRTAIRTYSEP